MAKQLTRIPTQVASQDVHAAIRSAGLLAIAGTAALTLQGCGMFASSGTEQAPSSTAATVEDPSTSQGGARKAANPGAGQGTSQAMGSPTGGDAQTSPVAVGGADMSASAGTGAWINPQARLEPGDDNAPATFNLQQITFAQEGADFDPSISRDGQKVVFASTQHRPTADLYVKSVTGRTITQLTSDPAEDGTPDISPDGTKVAFASNRDGNWDIFVMPMVGGKAVQITSDQSDELHPSWSADGNSLVFSRMGPTSGRWEMWVTDAGKAGNATFIGYGLFPRFCPSGGTGSDGGDRIVFQLGRERGQRSFAIWTIDYREGQSSNPTLIASSPAAALINPTWSPDGKFIVYSSVPSTDAWPAGGGPPAAELWLASVTADASVRLTSSDLRAVRPAWGPSNRLYFVSSRNATENIWSIDLAQSLASIGGSPEKSTTTAAGRTPSSGSAKGNTTRNTGVQAALTPQDRNTRTATKSGGSPAPSEDEQASGATADAGDENQ